MDKKKNLLSSRNSKFSDVERKLYFTIIWRWVMEYRLWDLTEQLPSAKKKKKSFYSSYHQDFFG